MTLGNDIGEMMRRSKTELRASDSSVTGNRLNNMAWRAVARRRLAPWPAAYRGRPSLVTLYH